MKFAPIAITIMLAMTMTITKPSDYGDDNDHKDGSWCCRWMTILLLVLPMVLVLLLMNPETTLFSKAMRPGGGES